MTAQEMIEKLKKVSPDPLPEDYGRRDLDRHRLTLEQAVDRWVDQAVKGGA